MRSEVVAACRQVSLKIAGVFAGIERLFMTGGLSRVEEEYVEAIKQTTREGSHRVRSISAAFKSDPLRTLRQPVNRIPHRAGNPRYTSMSLA